MDISVLISDFMNQIATGQLEVYNEFSLQHEMGIFLREKISDYKIQFERNTKYFGIQGTVKHEIDIVIYNEKEKYAIELKYPLNGQYPEQMFSFVKDIKFLEELKEAGFDGTYCLSLVQDKNFYSGQKQDGIYSYFRGKEPVSGLIIKPTGKKDERVAVHGRYHVDWKKYGDYASYWIVI